MWKFLKFAITQILREINFRDSRSAKSAILTHLEALDFDFYAFSHIFKAEIDQIKKSRTQNRTRMAKTAVLELLDYQKLISRKI